MSNELVSVIVPVYNVEKHISKCVDSIVNQSYKNLEIILLNDGSPDNSISVLNEYAQKDSRIIVVDKENEGVAKTRNKGIELATGKYLVFSDSDDMYDVEFVEKAVFELEKGHSQYISGAFETFNENGRLTKVDYLSAFGTELDINDYLDVMAKYQAGAYWGANWGKMFISSIVNDNNIRYESDVKFAEDFRFNLEYLKYVKHVSLIHEPVYYYRVDTQNSLSKGNVDLLRYWKEYRELAYRYKELYSLTGAYERNESKIGKIVLNAANDLLRKALKSKNAPRVLFDEMVKTADIELKKEDLKKMKLEHRMCYKALMRKKPFWLFRLLSAYNMLSRHK